MSYQNISGLELFQKPFHRTQDARPQASCQQANMQGENSKDLQKKAMAPVAPQPDPVVATQVGSVPGKGIPAMQPEQFEPQDKKTGSGDVATKGASPAQNQAAVSESSKSAQKKELVLDMSSYTAGGKPLTASDQEKREAHEAAEAKRKAEWDAKQLAKKRAEEDSLQKLNAMSDEEVIAASVKRVSADVERITRRNMKECVAAHIQELARKDPAFARRTMHPSKSIINCFKYINRMAKSYIQQEMAENDIQIENGTYGGDVPDDVIYQYSVDYYNLDNLREDQEKEEKFVPKPYVNTTPKKKKVASKTKKSDNPGKEDKEKQEPSGSFQQMSLF